LDQRQQQAQQDKKEELNLEPTPSIGPRGIDAVADGISLEMLPLACEKDLDATIKCLESDHNIANAAVAK
jgi:hypothetical protein